MAKAATNEIQVFEDFTDDEVKIIYQFSERKFYQRDEVVFKEKSKDGSLYVVLSGTLEAVAHTSDKKKISLSSISEGEVFGELSFLDGKQRSATIQAVKDVELLQISREDFDNMRQEYPAIASKLIMDLARVVSLRLRNADKFIVDIYQLINKQEEDEDKSEVKTAPAKASKAKTSKKSETKALDPTPAKSAKKEKASPKSEKTKPAQKAAKTTKTATKAKAKKK